MKISCIIPAFNEEQRISAVLGIVKNSNSLDQIIVVDDGSDDTTSSVIASYPKVELIRFEQNRGKSAAVEAGLQKSVGEYILLLDADLPGLCSEDIDNLVKPVLNNEVDMTLGFIGDFFQSHFFKIDTLSGIRCINKSHLERFFEKYKPEDYTLEVLMNDYILKNKLSFSVADIDNSRFIYSTEKHGLFRGIKKILSKWLQIFKSFGFVGFWKQYWLMTKKRS